MTEYELDSIDFVLLMSQKLQEARAHFAFMLYGDTLENNVDLVFISSDAEVLLDIGKCFEFWLLDFYREKKKKELIYTSIQEEMNVREKRLFLAKLLSHVWKKEYFALFLVQDFGDMQKTSFHTNAYGFDWYSDIFSKMFKKYWDV